MVSFSTLVVMSYILFLSKIRKRGNTLFLSVIEKGGVGYFVPVNYFATDLGSFITPRELTSTLPLDTRRSSGSYPLPILGAAWLKSAEALPDYFRRR